MLGFLRAYLYWTVLWGFLAHPTFGLLKAVPALLLGADAAMMLVTGIYVLHNSKNLRGFQERQVVRSTALCLLIFAAYGLAITVGKGGDLLDGAKYMGVLVRPVLTLLALYVYAHTPSRKTPSPAKLRRTLNRDLLLLVTAQLAVATLQLLDPLAGADFVAVFVETQSAAAALEDGDVSGTFANSIDLAYFLVAAYMALTAGHWRRQRAPSLVLTVVLGYFTYATGSVAAAVCFTLYALYLYIRLIKPRARRALLVLCAATGAALLFANAELVTELVTAKIENMMFSRLGLIFISLPAIAQINPLTLITGTGADFTVVDALLKSLPEVPLVFTYEDVASVINDVFWVAMVLAIGLPAVAYYLFKSSKLFVAYFQGPSTSRQTRSLLMMIALVIFLAGWLNQILAVRSFTTALLIGLLPLAVELARPRSSEGRLHPAGLTSPQR